MIICILGRQPAIGLAELESRFSAENVSPTGKLAASVKTAGKNVPVHLLGSVIKVAVPIKTLPDTDWSKIIQFTTRHVVESADQLPEGKLKLGLSVYDLPVSLKTLQRSGLELKKAIRANGRSVRIVPNTNLELNSAQIIHNRLTDSLGRELLFIRDGHRTIVAETKFVQNIDDYARRDFGRPKRDAFVGMLPPKLAQTMLNLAQARPHKTVLDPFCGTGVVLQEAALMGCDLIGSDISERMIDFTRHNLDWLKTTYHTEFSLQLEVADATTATWPKPIDTVVCETYLGQPLSALPSPGKLEKIRRECDAIASQFLKNLHTQLQPGTRCCIAVPAWFNGSGFVHLNVVDYLEKMGYNRLSFSGATQGQLIYHRSDQIVARELLVLTVKE